jgi:hypothetical protein
LNDEISPEVLDGMLDGLAAAGLIERYEVDGKRFVAVRSWEEYQHPQRRAKASKFPSPGQGRPVTPPAPSASPPRHVREPSASPPRVVPLGEGEGEGEGEKPLSRDLERKPARAPAIPPGDTDPPEFTAFWDCYPRRVAKGAARRAWRNAVKKADPVLIVAGAREFRAAVEAEGREAQFVPHPSTWLNGERWADEITESYWDELARWAADDVIDVEPVE